MLDSGWYAMHVLTLSSNSMMILKQKNNVALCVFLYSLLMC